MALSIGVRRGSKILIGAAPDGTGGELLRVIEVPKFNEVRLKFQGTTHTITDKERVLIAPNVYVSCGAQQQQDYEEYSRLAFEAPRSIKINRI